MCLLLVNTSAAYISSDHEPDQWCLTSSPLPCPLKGPQCAEFLVSQSDTASIEVVGPGQKRPERRKRRLLLNPEEV